ncbi:hypothetical protein, partial [Coleofasciculus chthonoplastes]|uniref:hypothetical protein n=1 Tax=Coleofasciculus chthonoplastes TaxID=64178 RepID=UPI0032FD70DA
GCRLPLGFRFRTTLPAFYSGEYARAHFLLIARELVLAYNKQVVNNKLAIHPTLNRRLERGEPIAG